MRVRLNYFQVDFYTKKCNDFTDFIIVIYMKVLRYPIMN